MSRDNRRCGNSSAALIMRVHIICSDSDEPIWRDTH